MRLCILGLTSARCAVGILSLFAAVVDANGERDPGKGAKNDLAVMDVCFILLVQVEHLPVAVGEQIQPGLLLWKSGCHGIVNSKGVEPSKFSEMDSEDALKTFNKTKRSIMVKKAELDAPLDIWLLSAVWTHATPHVRCIR